MIPHAILEKSLPWIVAGTTACIHGFFFPHSYPNSATELFGNVVNVSGVAVGFLATGQALLCSLNDNYVVKILRKLNRLEQMLSYFSSAIRWCFAAAVFSLFSYWTDFKTHPFLFSAWFGVFTAAIVATLRVLRLLGQILHGGENSG